MAATAPLSGLWCVVVQPAGIQRESVPQGRRRRGRARRVLSPRGGQRHRRSALFLQGLLAFKSDLAAAPRGGIATLHPGSALRKPRSVRRLF